MEGYRYFLTFWLLLRHMRGFVLMSLVMLFGVACASEAPLPKSPNDCDDTEYVGKRPGYPLRLPHKAGFLTQDYHPLPSSGDVPWFADAERLTEARVQKHLLGQAVTIRSPLFGGATPQCAQNADFATAVENEKRAASAGEDAGRKYGEVLGRVQSGIDYLANGWAHDGQLLKRILANADEREALLRAVAKDFEDVPDLPTYSDPALARKALAGFEKGYRAGIETAHMRAFFVNVTVDIYFMAIGGIAGALESAGAKLLDNALMRIRGMPIFIPGTVGGAGFFLKTVQRVAGGSSRKLLNNLLAAGKEPLEGEVPHHIVAHTDVRAERAREILAKFDLKVDEAPNGVFLPGTTNAPNPKGKAVHTKVHTNEYYKAVETALKDASSKEQVISVLERVGLKLEKGGL